MGWLRRLANTLLPDRAERTIDEETRFHVDELIDELVRGGMPAAEARREARRRFGNPRALRERTRDADVHRWLSDGAQDLRFAVRTLLKSPGFTLVAIVTLALGIGATTAIFTLFDALLLRPLPVAEPSRLVLFSDEAGEGTSSGSPPTGRWIEFSNEVYRHLRDDVSLGFSSIAAVRSGETAILVRRPDAPAAQPQRAQAHLVSGNYFDTMGVAVARGRALTLDDDRAGAAPVAVVSDGFWQRTLQSDPAAIGRTIVLNQTAFTIVGVTPPEFFGERVRRAPDFWMPLVFQPAIELRPSVLDRTDTYWLSLIGRLAPGQSRTRVATAATGSLRRFLTASAGAAPSAERTAEIRDSRIELSDGASGVSGLRSTYAQPLRVLLAVVALVLLLACANVANLLLTRATARAGEMAMRTALGAGRSRLVRQLLTESLLLAVIGAVCGLLLASWTSRALLAQIVSSSAPVRATLNAGVLAVTAAIAIAAGLLFGTVPALQASRLDLVAAIRTRHSGGLGGARRSRAAHALVIVQIAVSVVLVVGAVLFARSLVNLQRQTLGFDADGVLLARLSPRLAGYAPPAATAMYRSLQERIAALPGVRSATFARYSPFGGSRSVHGGHVEGYTSGPQEHIGLETVQVGPDYPVTLGIAVRRGRAIDVRDKEGAPRVAMVNEAFVHRFLPNVDPIGRRVGVSDDRALDMQIVGVIADARFRDADKAVEPIVFTAMLQENSQFALDCELALRTGGGAAPAAAELRAAVAEIAHDVPMNDPRTLTSQVAGAFDSQRLAARLIAAFGLLALTLACVGLYGTIAQQVAQRTTELGVRMALGADRAGVLRLVLGRIVALVALGLAVGLPAAIGGSRLVASQLFGVGAIDPMSIGAAIVALVVVAAVSGFVPALRATRISPVQALRGE